MPSIPLTDLPPQHSECWPEWLDRLQHLRKANNWILGPEVSAFEAEFAAAMRAPYCVGVASGTAALQIALRLRGIESPDQQVLTSPLTAPFTAQAILAAGGTPIFADIDPDTLLLDPDRAAEAIGPNTAALLPVHLYGQPVDLNRWRELSQRHRIPLIQDACQAHGATDRGRPLLSSGELTAYSFYPTKNLGGLGDGGALCCHDEADAIRACQLRDGARGPGHSSLEEAWNERLDELQAAFLRIALRRLPEWNEARVRLAQLYDQELASIPPDLLRPVGRRPGADHVYHLYVVIAEKRDELRDVLAAEGIGTGIHYPTPLHRQPAFTATAQPAEFPIAESAASRIVSLPIGPFLADSSVRQVCATIRNFYGL